MSQFVNLTTPEKLWNVTSSIHELGNPFTISRFPRQCFDARRG